ncbi:hypothetical protein [Rhodopseudomonas palustris]|uniref:hypothetical protein n=1 Tax=Rhodopseudomonas palustris TaxID=1076 RepID=UPI001F3F1878|nr:hypothetical protein [Rhodopseudomonas palustris]
MTGESILVRVIASRSVLRSDADSLYALGMKTTIKPRSVRAALLRRLKSRAALAGLSLTDYLTSELDRGAKRPTLDEWRVRLHSRPEVRLSVAPAEAVRAERGDL